MNAPPQPTLDVPAPAAPSAPPAHEESRFVIYVRLALTLAVITGIEIILVNLPFATWFLFGALVTLSIAKFLCVIFVFMHLRWDRIFCTLLFLIGLVLALGTVAALLALFQSEASVPLTSPAAPPAATSAVPLPAPSTKTSPAPSPAPLLAPSPVAKPPAPAPAG
jgi:cytochrome c oxidase subunit IV